MKNIQRPAAADCQGRCKYTEGRLDCNSTIQFQGDNWGCTLPPGHEGPHIACGVWNHNYVSWEDDDLAEQPAQPQSEEAVNSSQGSKEPDAR